MSSWNKVCLADVRGEKLTNQSPGTWRLGQRNILEVVSVLQYVFLAN